jgi:hypothetical protein
MQFTNGRDSCSYGRKELLRKATFRRSAPDKPRKVGSVGKVLLTQYKGEYKHGDAAWVDH